MFVARQVGCWRRNSLPLKLAKLALEQDVWMDTPKDGELSRRFYKSEKTKIPAKQVPDVAQARANF